MDDYNSAGSLLRPMRARDTAQEHRAATALELLFDLCFVVAIAQAAHALAHSIAHGHSLDGLVSFTIVFFAVWWAWMNFTWFASAFDNDDVLYRLKILLQMMGAVVIAAGVTAAFEEKNFTVMVIGWVIIRVGMVAQWLRVAKHSKAYRVTGRRYVIGITLCQLGWVSMLFMGDWWWLAFLVLLACELLVPYWAESAKRTPWHPGHIAERYGLLTIIVIGESVLAAVMAVQSAIAAEQASVELWCLIVSAPVILFAMWWLYFLKPADELLEAASLRLAFWWAYAHFAVFASAAAVGAALALGIDVANHSAHISAITAGFALAIPCAVFLIALRLMLFLPRNTSASSRRAVVLAAVVLLGTPFVPYYAAAIALILAGLTATVLWFESRTA